MNIEQRATQLESVSKQLINQCQHLEKTVNSLKKLIVENENSHKIEIEKFSQIVKIKFKISN